jgi:curved DNA-binding protein CbpA
VRIEHSQHIHAIMKLDSKYFDSLRAKPAPQGEVRTESGCCQWEGCREPGIYRAPQGRGREGQYFRFCLNHVQQYNKSYNYFDGMSDIEVAAFQKSAATGHRPTWTVGGNMGSLDGVAQRPHSQRWGGAGRRPFRPGDTFGLFGESAEAPHARQQSERPSLGNMARKSLRALNLNDLATKTEIKTRFKALVKRHHPDANGGDRSSEERLREIIQAYNYLKQAGLC